MKKKSENKNISAEAETKEKRVKEMSDAEFEHYIDGIMVDDQKDEAVADKNQTIMADDIQTLREDVNKIIAELGALGELVRSKQLEAEKPVQAENTAAAPEAFPETFRAKPMKVNEADKAKLYDELMAQQKRYQLFRQRMKAQEDDIKKYFADFNFKFLYDNDPEFKAEFDKMGSVYGAYLKYLARHTAPGRGFVENGAMPAMAAGSVSTSPAGLPDKEFDEYIRNILGE